MRYFILILRPRSFLKKRKRIFSSFIGRNRKLLHQRPSWHLVSPRGLRAKRRIPLPGHRQQPQVGDFAGTHQSKRSLRNHLKSNEAGDDGRKGRFFRCKKVDKRLGGKKKIKVLSVIFEISLVRHKLAPTVKILLTCEGRSKPKKASPADADYAHTPLRALNIFPTSSDLSLLPPPPSLSRSPSSAWIQ